MVGMPSHEQLCRWHGFELSLDDGGREVRSAPEPWLQRLHNQDWTRHPCERPKAVSGDDRRPFRLDRGPQGTRSIAAVRKRRQREAYPPLGQPFRLVSEAGTVRSPLGEIRVEPRDRATESVRDRCRLCRRVLRERTIPIIPSRRTSPATFARAATKAAMAPPAE